jgi:hypothetical protein
MEARGQQGSEGETKEEDRRMDRIMPTATAFAAVGEAGRYTNNRSKEYRKKNERRIMGVYYTQDYYITNKNDDMAVHPQPVPNILEELVSFCHGKKHQEGKRWALCITPTICVFIVTSHCLLHMMNKRDQQKANINIKMEANLSQMKPKLSAERQPVGWHLPFL